MGINGVRRGVAPAKPACKEGLDGRLCAVAPDATNPTYRVSIKITVPSLEVGPGSNHTLRHTNRRYKRASGVK